MQVCIRRRWDEADIRVGSEAVEEQIQPKALMGRSRHFGCIDHMLDVIALHSCRLVPRPPHREAVFVSWLCRDGARNGQTR